MTETHEQSAKPSPFNTQVEEPEVWKRVIKVEVSRRYFEQEYGRRLRAAVKEHVRPGFRKGKTPKATVEKELGARLRAQTVEHVIPQAFKAAIVEHELVPITDPRVENLVLDEDQPFTFDMIVEVRPKITARDYDGLTVQRRAPMVESAEVDAVLSRLQESRAIFEDVDRPAQNGDRIVLDIVPLDEDGEPEEQGLATDQKLLLGDENNLPAFNEAFTDVRPDEERSVTVRYPDDFHNRQLRGNEVSYRCQIKAVQQKQLPELDDAFAAGFQEGQTLLEMRSAIRADLLREEEARIQRELEEQLVDHLIARNDISVPPSLVEQYLQSGLEELHGRNAQQGRPNTTEEDAQYRATTQPVAERILKGMFIMEAIRRQESIQVSDEEVDARITEIAEQHNFELEKYRDYVARGGERDRIVHGLEERKTFDFLLSRAVIEEQAAPQAKAEQD
jgi:trigger factor